MYTELEDLSIYHRFNLDAKRKVIVCRLAPRINDRFARVASGPVGLRALVILLLAITFI